MPGHDNIAESLRNWFLECEAINNAKQFGVDFLGQNAEDMAIVFLSADLKKDICGNYKITRDFSLTSTKVYGAEVIQNIANLGFFEKIIEWMVKKNDLCEYPKIENSIMISCLPVSTPVLIMAGEETGRYELQCKLSYILMKGAID